MQALIVRKVTEHMHEYCIPAIYSVLSASALQEHVLPAYSLGPICSCRLLDRGANDHYLVQTDQQRYILRVYYPGAHEQEQVFFEIDALIHLSCKGVPVAAPLTKKDGSFVTTLHAPEGERYAVLFQYAPGGHLPKLDPEISAYGRALAQIHTGWDNFRSVHAGRQLSLEYFLEKPLKTFLPLLAHRANEETYLLELVEDLKHRFVQLPSDVFTSGVCHGDIHGGNAHITANQIVTFYDFEFIGWGWQIYDLATFSWPLQLNKGDDTLWKAFLEGYTSQRSVGEPDLQAVPFFVVLRHLFLLGLHASRRDAWGDNALDDKYLDRHLAFIRACVEKL